MPWVSRATAIKPDADQMVQACAKVNGSGAKRDPDIALRLASADQRRAGMALSRAGRYVNRWLVAHSYRNDA
jgi:hypothetical protein